ncbi:translation initiation factor IF-2, partial [Plesiocystis pacifica SIR-1]
MDCGGQAHRGIARSFRHIWTELGLQAWLLGQLADGSRRLWI